MNKIILCSFLILLLIPTSQSLSQVNDESTLSISLNSEHTYVYSDSEGYVFVVGIIENNDLLTSITGIQIQVRFFDDFNSDPLEVIQGTTTLDVVAPNGKSPYSIRSSTPNPNITQASVSILGFDSSEEKQKGLTVYATDVSVDESFKFSGILENIGAPNTNTNVYLAFYDAFEPPRILKVSTIGIGDVAPDAKVPFELDEMLDPQAVGFSLFAESDIFHSDFVDVKIPRPQLIDKLLTISDVRVEDSDGNKLSELFVGSEASIRSVISIQSPQIQKDDETDYTYYIQIKQSGKIPFIEYIEKFDGRFIGIERETQTINWIPEKPGLFFIETFVWDENNVPLAEQGPFVLLVVK